MYVPAYIDICRQIYIYIYVYIPLLYIYPCCIYTSVYIYLCLLSLYLYLSYEKFLKFVTYTRVIQLDQFVVGSIKIFFSILEETKILSCHKTKSETINDIRTGTYSKIKAIGVKQVDGLSALEKMYPYNFTSAFYTYSLQISNVRTTRYRQLKKEKGRHTKM